MIWRRQTQVAHESTCTSPIHCIMALLPMRPPTPPLYPDASAKVPELCVEYGQQLEFQGSNDEALSMFESALRSTSEELTPHASADKDHVIREAEPRRAVCLAGVARCTLRSGDLRKGLRLAKEAG